MFHLPIEIIQLIFEFDSTYRDEYNKCLNIIKELPAFIQDKYVYIFNSRYSSSVHSFYPSKFYFQLLRNSNSLYIYAKSKTNYNHVISEMKHT